MPSTGPRAIVPSRWQAADLRFSRVGRPGIEPGTRGLKGRTALYRLSPSRPGVSHLACSAGLYLCRACRFVARGASGCVTKAFPVDPVRVRRQSWLRTVSYTHLTLPTKRIV